MDEKTLTVIKWAGAIVLIAGFVGYFTIHPFLGGAIMIVGMICTLVGIFVPASDPEDDESVEDITEDVEIGSDNDPNEDNIVNAEEAETKEEEQL